MSNLAIKRPAPSTLATKRATIRVKAASITEDGTFEGYGSLFGVVDTYGDVVMPGAFAASLAAHKAAGTRPKMLWQHDPTQPIGTWLDMYEDDTGLYCKGKILTEVAQGRECLALMRAGEIDALSIGYNTELWESGQRSDFEQKFHPAGYGGQDVVCKLQQLDLQEVSPVTWGACPGAGIDAVKAAPNLAPLAAALLQRRALIDKIARAA